MLLDPIRENRQRRAAEYVPISPLAGHSLAAFLAAALSLFASRFLRFSDLPPRLLIAASVLTGVWLLVYQFDLLILSVSGALHSEVARKTPTEFLLRRPRADVALLTLSSVLHVAALGAAGWTLLGVLSGHPL
jgi:hypothetical protein